MTTLVYGLVEEKGDDAEDTTGWIYSMVTLMHILFTSCVYSKQNID